MTQEREKAKSPGWLSGCRLVVLKPTMEMPENVQESSSNFLYANGGISVIPRCLILQEIRERMLTG